MKYLEYNIKGSPKKLEVDVNELEVALDHANRTNANSQKVLKRMQQNLTDL